MYLHYRQFKEAAFWKQHQHCFYNSDYVSEMKWWNQWDALLYECKMYELHLHLNGCEHRWNRAWVGKPWFCPVWFDWEEPRCWLWYGYVRNSMHKLTLTLSPMMQNNDKLLKSVLFSSQSWNQTADVNRTWLAEWLLTGNGKYVSAWRNIHQITKSIINISYKHAQPQNLLIRNMND